MGSRYVKEIALNIDSHDVENIIQEYLRVNDFKLVSEKGEDYYKSGGVMLPLRGFIYNYQNGTLHLEAWYGKIGKELNIGDGKLYGAKYKIPYYNSILSLLNVLEKSRQMHNQSNEQMQASEYAQANGDKQESVYNQHLDNSTQTISEIEDEVNKANNRNAMFAFWLSLASLILIFESNYMLIIDLASFTLAFKYGLKSEKKGFAKAAIFINIIVIAITLGRVF